MYGSRGMSISASLTKQKPSLTTHHLRLQAGVPPVRGPSACVCPERGVILLQMFIHGPGPAGSPGPGPARGGSPTALAARKSLAARGVGGGVVEPGAATPATLTRAVVRGGWSSVPSTLYGTSAGPAPAAAGSHRERTRSRSSRNHPTTTRNTIEPV